MGSYMTRFFTNIKNKKQVTEQEFYQQLYDTDTQKNSIAKTEQDADFEQEMRDSQLPYDDNALKRLIEKGSVDDAAQEDYGYQSDERSGDEVTDSEAEFDDIVKMENFIREFKANTFVKEDLHNKIQSLFETMIRIQGMIELDSESVKYAIEEVAAKEIQFFASYARIVRVAQLGYQLQLQSKIFWQSIINFVLINYHEMEINHIIQLIYFAIKMGNTDLALDTSLFTENQKLKLRKISKYASFQLMVQYLKDQVENVLDIDKSFSEDPLFLLKFYTVITDQIPQLMDKQQLKERIVRLGNYLMNETEGLNYYLKQFNYEYSIDLIRLLPNEDLSVESFEVLTTIFQHLSKKKSFYRCKKPVLADASLILQKLKYLVDNNPEAKPEKFEMMKEIIRVIVIKAVTRESVTKAESEEKKKEEEKEKEKNPEDQKELIMDEADARQLQILNEQYQKDLEFIKLIKQSSELKLFDANLSKVVLFETSQQILEQSPFVSEEDATIKLQLVLLSLQFFNQLQANENATAQEKEIITSKFIIDFNEVLRHQIYENEEFDQHLHAEQYMILKDITQQLIISMGLQNDEQSQQQIEYLERKIYNYSKLFTI